MNRKISSNNLKSYSNFRERSAKSFLQSCQLELEVRLSVYSVTSRTQGAQRAYKPTMRKSTKRPEEDQVSEYVFARALYPSIHVHSSVLHALPGCCGKEGFNDSRSCVDLRPLKHIECALYVCKLGQALCFARTPIFAGRSIG